METLKTIHLLIVYFPGCTSLKHHASMIFIIIALEYSDLFLNTIQYEYTNMLVDNFITKYSHTVKLNMFSIRTFVIERVQIFDRLKACLEQNQLSQLITEICFVREWC